MVTIVKLRSVHQDPAVQKKKGSLWSLFDDQCVVLFLCHHGFPSLCVCFLYPSVLGVLL